MTETEKPKNTSFIIKEIGYNAEKVKEYKNNQPMEFYFLGQIDAYIFMLNWSNR